MNSFIFLGRGGTVIPIASTSPWNPSSLSLPSLSIYFPSVPRPQHNTYRPPSLILLKPSLSSHHYACTLPRTHPSIHPSIFPSFLHPHIYYLPLTLSQGSARSQFSLPLLSSKSAPPAPLSPPVAWRCSRPGSLHAGAAQGGGIFLAFHPRR